MVFIFIFFDLIFYYFHRQCKSVFSGINVDPSEYILIGSLTKPRTTITGILERYNFYNLYQIATTINKNIQSITIITDTSASGIVLKDICEQQIAADPSKWPPTRSFVIKYFSELQKFILEDPISTKQTDLLLFTVNSGFLLDNGIGIGGNTLFFDI